MPLPPPITTTTWRGQLLGGALARDRLLDLPALERPVLELEHVRLGKKLEAVHRLGALDGLERGPIAEVGGDGAALVGERGDQAETGHQDHLGPVVERTLAGRGVASVIGLVLGAGRGEPAPRLGDERVGGRREVEVEPDRKAAGAEQVLGRRHAAAGPARASAPASVARISSASS